MKPALRSLVAVLAVALAACSTGVPRISPHDADAQVRSGKALLIDVRESDEVAAGMAAPAQWYALSRVEADPQAFAQFLQQNAKGKQLIFYCAMGGRAQKVAERAHGLGYPVANMGGFSGWASAGLPVARK